MITASLLASTYYNICCRYSRGQHFEDNPPRALLRPAVYSGPPRPQNGLGPTARWFVVPYVVSVLIYHFPGLWERSPSFYQRLRALGQPPQHDRDALSLSDCHVQHAGTGVHFYVLMGVMMMIMMIEPHNM
jgi:hypothetical protein